MAREVTASGGFAMGADGSCSPAGAETKPLRSGSLGLVESQVTTVLATHPLLQGTERSPGCVLDVPSAKFYLPLSLFQARLPLGLSLLRVSKSLAKSTSWFLPFLFLSMV